MVALIYNAEAIMLFNNLAVFATLLILTYAFDALLFSLAYDLRLLPRDQGLDRTIVVWALSILCLVSVIVYNDYRLNIEALQFAIIGMFLNLTPGALTHVLWNTPLRSTLALSIGSKSPYEATEENVPDAIDATVHLSLGLMLISTLKEENKMDGFQIFMPKSPSLDTIYRAATKNRLQIVIAHSAGESIPVIKGIVTGILSSQPAVVAHKPDVLIYTKDPSEDIVKKIRAENWDSLPTQTLFITTSQHTINNFDLIGRRLFDYYNPAQLPPAAENSDILTGFLNLGELESCDCYGCYDKSGWNDTFRLIPSMWSASRPVEKDETPYRCTKAILTHGNNFIASAARIRGIGKDIWETLDDALSNPSLSRGWAHDRLKLGPDGRNAKISGEKDSLEKPHLGYTVERLWGSY
ncbi:hypothetical protein H4I96_09085 [Botrytis cinerea]